MRFAAPLARIEAFVRVISIFAIEKLAGGSRMFNLAIILFAVVLADDLSGFSPMRYTISRQ